MQYNNTHIVIVVGGVGSRFWPMSKAVHRCEGCGSFHHSIDSR